MKCSTCQKPTTATIDGRMFCGDCGDKAAQRLQNFRQQTTAHSQENVLDLNQARQSTREDKEHVNPVKSLHGTHANNFHGNTQPAKRTEQQLGAMNEGTPAAQITRFGGQMITPQSKSPDFQVPPSESQVAQTAEYKQEPAPTQESAQSFLSEMEPQEDTQVTHMQPHQTYSLKENTPQQNQFLSQYIANSDMPDNADNNIGTLPSQKKKRKWFPSGLFNGMALRAATVGLCVLLLGGYVTYLNYPHIAVRVAAGQADIDASLPEYTPEGYKFRGPVTYGPNQLTVSFGSSDDSNISITQSSTNWDSESLLENHVRYQTSRYDTYREDGLIIYTYDNRYATWVNGGIMYEIESSESLGEEEIVRMAGSL